MDIEARLREVELEIGSRRAEHQISPTLDRIAALVSLLGDPQRAFPVVHVTGTNGKTSTTRMIDTLLRERGLRTGRFTSPHLVSMRERICVDGEPVSAERFIELYDELSPYVELVDAQQPAPLSFFEVLTGMMFAAFADAPVDVAVIEVGLGGRWDATNVADGAVAVITPIALDHMQWLGDTIEEIATEKAGIIKPGAIAVLAQQEVAAAEILLQRAALVGATVAREGFEFGVLARELALGGQQVVLQGLRGVYAEMFLPLFGVHQASNAACALAAVEAFAGVSVTAPVGDDGSMITLGPGLSRGRPRPGAGPRRVPKVSSPGRLEILRRSPTVIADAAHNPAGMAATVQALTESFDFDRVIGVVAVAEDKDVAGLLDELEPVLSDDRGDHELLAPVDARGRTGRAGQGHLRRGPGARRGAAGRRHRPGVLAGRRRRRRRVRRRAAGLVRGARHRLRRHRGRRAAAARPGERRGPQRQSRAPEPGTPARHSFTLGELS